MTETRGWKCPGAWRLYRKEIDGTAYEIIGREGPYWSVKCGGKLIATAPRLADAKRAAHRHAEAAK